MGAQWAVNEVTAAKRRCDLIIYADSGAPAPRGTDFIALGMVYITASSGGVSSIDLALATGTCTNKRRPLVVADDVVESVDTGADSLELTAHGYETGDGPFVSDEAMGAIGPTVEFWIIKDDADNIGIAASLADAYAGTRVALAGTETGATISDKATTKRGIDGFFTYEATQAETNTAASELAVIVEGSGYARANNGGTYTSVAMVSSADDYGSGIIEGSITRDDATRGILSILAGRSSGYNTGTIVFRDLANTKNRWTFTVDDTGRLTSTANDLT